jgi:hypothetical protein
VSDSLSCGLLRYYLKTPRWFNPCRSMPDDRRPVLVSKRVAMRGFLIGWVVAFALVGAVAYGLNGAFEATAPPTRPTGVTSVERPDTSFEPFTQDAAIQVVGARLGSGPRGEQNRRELLQAARVTYHSAQHWTVRWGAASWTAHGPGRYAEPDNDAAREREAEAATGS